MLVLFFTSPIFTASDNVMTQVGRIQVSISPTNTDIVYCAVSDDAG